MGEGCRDGVVKQLVVHALKAVIGSRQGQYIRLAVRTAKIIGDQAVGAVVVAKVGVYGGGV